MKSSWNLPSVTVAEEPEDQPKEDETKVKVKEQAEAGAEANTDLDDMLHGRERYEKQFIYGCVVPNAQDLVSYVMLHAIFTLVSCQVLCVSKLNSFRFCK